MIGVVAAELAEASAEAVIRPVTAEWDAVTPAMRRLELAAGDAPVAQCRTLGELPVGSAVITSAGDLSAQFMIHIIVRSVDEPVTASGIRRGLQNALRRVSEWGIGSVALPPLGTGAGNLDAEESAEIMLPLLREALDAGPLRAAEIRVDSEYELEVFTRYAAAGDEG